MLHLFPIFFYWKKRWHYVALKAVKPFPGVSFRDSATFFRRGTRWHYFRVGGTHIQSSSLGVTPWR
jgi:hypothetical protein